VHGARPQPLRQPKHGPSGWLTSIQWSPIAERAVLGRSSAGRLAPGQSGAVIFSGDIAVLVARIPPLVHCLEEPEILGTLGSEP